MALEKEIPVNDSGVNATYWRVTGINIDMLANTSEVLVSGYIDEAARNSGKRPIMTRSIRWIGSANPITPTNIMNGTVFAAVYDKLKEENINPFLPDNPFLGASDV